LELENTIPESSMLETSNIKFDYIDTFNIQLERSDVKPWELIVAFFACSPHWLNSILRLRNKIINVLGLKADIIDLHEMHPPFSKGAQCGLFKLYDIDELESVMGEDNFHLDFRLSLQIDKEKRLHITTAIKFNNVFGKIYLALIKPFHKFIVRWMIKKMAYSINNQMLTQS